jgi:pantoate--beta-alanine ligase
MSKVAVFTTVAAMRAAVKAWRAAGERVALVPTMGALHAGHVSLVELARQRADRVIVSIFVNPTQFAPNEDFARYPRTFEADLARLDGRADAVFHPAADEVYPEGFCTTVSLGGPAVAGLEDRFRPTHFAGVATVVAKLLLQALPDVAIFGEKDYQQLAVIRRMARDLDIPVEILGGPTLRDTDGLALSSRNAYLTPQERAAAPVLHQALSRAAQGLTAGLAAAPVLQEARDLVTGAGFELDYLELRDAGSLAPIADVEGAEGRLLVAARLGRTRLIDNLAVDPHIQADPKLV